VGWSGTLLHYDDGDSEWDAIGSRSTDAHFFSGVWGSSASDVYVVGGFTDNEIFNYDGATWNNTFSSEGDELFLQAVWGSSSSDLFAVGTGGIIHHYNGSVWDTMNSGTTNVLSGIWGSSGSNVFTVGSGGTILQYDGNPEGTWSSEIASGTTKNLSGIWGSSASDVFTVGSGGTILRLHTEVTPPPPTTSTSVQPATTTIPLATTTIPPATTTSIAECESDDQCDDELFCTGEESCVEGRCRSVGNPCKDDNLFCNGEEICDEENDECVSSDNPCLPNLECNEESDACSGCLNDEECDDELFCNGAERCENGVCQSENVPCEEGEQCDEENDECKIPPAPCEISVEPDTAGVVSGQTLNFTISTASGDCTDFDYRWSVKSDIDSTIDKKNGNYVAGNNNDLFATVTDVVSVVDQTSGSEASATVTVSWKCFLIQLYGEDMETIALLRNFRDHVLSKTPEGREVIRLYYELSPFIVNTMEKDGVFKDEVRALVEGIMPLIEIQ
jgi:hypothetical protein